jgi:hypothetical protein
MLAAEVDPAWRWLLPPSRAKRALLARIKSQLASLSDIRGIRSAVAFRAVVAAPGGHGGYLARRRASFHPARFDIVVLLELDTLALARELRGMREFADLERDVRSASRYVETVVATNVKRIAPVDHDRDGVFLFNYFVAETRAQNIAAWEYTAGWFEQETGLDNSTVLAPVDSAATTYSVINHCRWDRWRDILPALVLKRSFEDYVLAHFEARDTAPMPILYRLA